MRFSDIVNPHICRHKKPDENWCTHIKHGRKSVECTPENCPLLAGHMRSNLHEAVVNMTSIGNHRVVKCPRRGGLL